MTLRTATVLLVALAFVPLMLFCQDAAFTRKLGDFDSYMEKNLKAWNAPGAGVGIVSKGRLVFAKGYGVRDFDKKLPVTSNTLFQIASNTKLFTAIGVGLLVEEGKLDWDKPIRAFVPTIQFFDENLNNTVSIRDMLAHRTGISRHDMIWYKSSFTRKELFERLKYLEPSQPLRQGFLYNNMMYAASGYVVEHFTGRTWEDFTRERIFRPLGMTSTVFSIEEMVKQPDHFVPFNERRDTTILYRIPFYEEAQGIGPAGSIISSINDLSRWLIALMNNGSLDGRQVIPSSVVKATLAPSIALPNTPLENRGFGELLNPVYGMGRWTASYRGHYLAYHGGDIDGIHSQISCMPYDSLGVIVFVIGDHSAPLYNIITYNIYERLLVLSQTPWSERRLKDRAEGRQSNREGRQKVGSDRVASTTPSHPIADFAGEYEHPAYGILKVKLEGESLKFDFHNIVLPLSHYHYDRFDTPNDEEYGLWSVNFRTNPQGEVSQAALSLDESEAVFSRKADASLSDPKILRAYAGKYRIGGTVVEVVLKEDNFLYIVLPGQPTLQLIPAKARRFRVAAFSDLIIEFVMKEGKTAAMRQIDPSGEYELRRVEGQ